LTSSQQRFFTLVTNEAALNQYDLKGGCGLHRNSLAGYQQLQLLPSSHERHFQ
jgi:hypothetical protein